ncbi:MAG: cyclohexanone monooxygenase [Panacagrimonas sp.]|nr:NAD(P)/FAD-dependent oxidoreductase [Panacagrimonas sp.]MCC2659014.1 cyclohexanone monooxygenase [Panacagrimonas sp.]
MSGHAANPPDFDALIIGAGFSGIAMLHLLREARLSARVFEVAPAVGGTWYWNTYPGARTDSESWYYCFSFSKALLEKWKWSERYPSQPEMRRYFDFALDELGLRPHIQCSTEVESAQWEDAARLWSVRTTDGKTTTARYLVSAMGLLNEPLYPSVPGMDRFEGGCYHTGRWPQEGVELGGKRVGILGAGASAVQFLPHAAEQAAQVTLFQRTPNYVFPARNRAITENQQRELQANYDAMWERIRGNLFAMPFEGSPANRLAAQTPPKERERIYSELWKTGGFRFFFESFDDLLVDEQANRTAADFMRRQIGDVVKDPATAAMLMPRDYPLFAKRPPSGQGYFEAFNQPNVRLVDVKRDPVVAIEPWGLRTRSGAEHRFDVLVLATGFRAFTGSFERTPVRGRDGVSLIDHWKRHGVRTWLGCAVLGFPNFFMLGGPQIPFGNAPTIVEHVAELAVACMLAARRRGADLVEIDPQAEREWNELVDQVMASTLVRHGEEVGSWFTGANVEGQKTSNMVYVGGANDYFRRCRETAAGGFREFAFR